MFSKDKSKKKDKLEDQPLEDQPLLTREDILGADDLISEIVHVPEWNNGYVKIRSLTGQERDQYQLSLIVAPGKSEEVDMRNATAKLLSLSIVNEQGRPIFGSDDILALGRKSGRALDRCYTVAKRLSAVTDEDIKELTENLAEGQSEDSISN